MERYGLKPGDIIMLAGQDIVVRGEVVSMPGGFSQGPVLGPRILVLVVESIVGDFCGLGS
jgi:Predicted ABC-type transport system involved in lysophospholipase L1 biosynthesis, permease component